MLEATRRNKKQLKVIWTLPIMEVIVVIGYIKLLMIKKHK